MGNRLERGGGWISGAGYNPLPAAAPNRPDESPIVGEAVEALNAFGEDLTRAMVRKLLPMWRYWPDLTPQDMVAILKRFPGRGDR